MRSGQIHTAIAQGFTPFEICRIVSRRVRIKHQHGTRMQDSIGEALRLLPQECTKEGLYTAPRSVPSDNHYRQCGERPN